MKTPSILNRYVPAFPALLSPMTSFMPLPSPTIPSKLINNLKEYLGITEEHVDCTLEPFWSLLDVPSSRIFGSVQVNNLRSDSNLTAHKPPAVVRSKLIEAFKFLLNSTLWKN